MVDELGREGRRAGKGFYDYGEGGKRLWPGLAEHYPVAACQPEPEELQDRLLYRQVVETLRCFREGVVRSAADANIGSIFGWGFPAYTGGTLQFIYGQGVDAFRDRVRHLAEVHGARFHCDEDCFAAL
jgi:3-hydroxyacyl-CoA dehydrogenase/enoyl-CoA hydratase/3-hydroxybutyryl-CoA epimerase